MRRLALLIVVALFAGACTLTFGPQQTPEEAYRLKVAEFKVQADAIQMRIVTGISEHRAGADGTKWADVPAAMNEFQALLADAAKIEPPIIYQPAHRSMISAIESFDLAMYRLAQFIETDRDDRYNDLMHQMRSGNGALTRLMEAVPAP